MATLWMDCKPCEFLMKCGASSFKIIQTSKGRRKLVAYFENCETTLRALDTPQFFVPDAQNKPKAKNTPNTKKSGGETPEYSEEGKEFLKEKGCVFAWTFIGRGSGSEYQVQARQLRKDHPDAHYCACLFWYLHEFAILYRSHKNIVSTNTVLVASDHDFTKLSLTPSVTFFIDIPESIEHSFYNGPNIPPILCLYTDGGPDHQITFGSVQISLLCLFLRGNFDILIALRTAPYHSWANPAERIMSIINLGLQGVAIMRDEMSSHLEEIFEKADTLEQIREAAKKNQNYYVHELNNWFCIIYLLKQKSR
ncbi:hypothetical protein GLOIN_2v1769008 [Rhizophagus irregularis DAOM 181602=DAOM 197198]|uniref:Uncharacterized protein n=1 Tax=Rhizophagus irregularis (strain DAOM 181602 / DAOM 197198 / MUCL 43194) TaxID=747089 RepID=A0A2P4QFI3_RHIID|nr:hypothetical protein GLOIN_2v1769008 [Rhizophagus irregularis DAOM 181602=DAOM 197198]POG76402.1 hypothetical protein GLOIN_2v1769008 [Rhizophagus irregularis DAOM 181602=DAOM 197198]|eukprot:XP_025183268.1 hypothetical protein GLOIN_2v1769008 [Rhizophagus irregularis DAOM 181602=DAOM 197198]